MSLHIAAEKGMIAPIVLLPGDPLRAKYIAEHFLENAELVSKTRNVFFYTGYYKGKRITVGASGMGCPSIGIYSFELYSFYEVATIIRIGTAGSYHPSIKLYDIINVTQSCSESSYAKFAFEFDEDNLQHQGTASTIISEVARAKNLNLLTGAVHSSDIFYRKSTANPAIVEKYNCMAVEMESFALFANARYLGKAAACLLTISDVIPTQEAITADARETSLKPMMELALTSAVALSA
jgi:purine-nucleoside phosphorylase